MQRSRLLKVICTDLYDVSLCDGKVVSTAPALVIILDGVINEEA